MMLRSALISLFVLSATASLWAQPSNDGCDDPIVLTDLDQWCSAPAQFTNVAATNSGYDPADCFSNASHDVWFSFVAQATDVTVTIIGATNPSPGGTLQRPEVALYSGACGGVINQLECAADVAGSNIVELYKGGLTIGESYLIRVEGRLNNVGTFELCINNYFPPVAPGSDCVSKALLCDKSPFVVQSVVGAGTDPDEAANTCLGGLGGNSESNSTWFGWVAANDGSLTFVLTPTNPTDDLDFVVYELPNGINSCAGKIKLRCMAAGDFNFPSPCMGPTGLSLSAQDTDESAGCVNDTGQKNNFVAALQMEAGKAYALMINNFTSTGNGFSISFGGTGEFAGPQAAFSSDPAGICAGESVTFQDASSVPNGQFLSGRIWNFGVGAQPATATGPGPHTVTYNTPGEKFVTLLVESNLGCQVSEVSPVPVDSCCGTENQLSINASITDVLCADAPTGSIALAAQGNFPPVQFDWFDASTGSSVANLPSGQYSVTVSDALCDSVLTLTVDGPPPLSATVQMGLATCAGGTDGSLSLSVSGGVPPYQYNWADDGIAGFTGNSSLQNLGIGFYDVTVQDANGCQLVLDGLEVAELELLLDPNIEAVTPPSCFGFSNGSIVLNIGNGQGPYLFDWNDGQGFQDENSLFNIASGDFDILVQDANGCLGTFSLSVVPPDPLVVGTDSVPVSCFGEADGEAIALPTGGTPPYNYIWSDFQTGPVAVGLVAGNYGVSVSDANGCDTFASVSVTQPDELFIDDIEVLDVLCFGDSTGTLTVLASGGNPPYGYNTAGLIDFQNNNVFENLPAGNYTVTVLDALGCTVSAPASISQPLELIVDAGEDQLIELGFSTTLQPQVVPFFASVDFAWQPSESLSCANCPRPVAAPVNTTAYVVTITDATGCTASDSVLVRVEKLRPVYIPNAFSPNIDGQNDAFTAFAGPAVNEIELLRIFNRWGDLLFEARNIPPNDERLGWDGTFNGQLMQPDVFAYYMEIEFIDGQVVLFKGDVTLTR